MFFCFKPFFVMPIYMLPMVVCPPLKVMYHPPKFVYLPPKEIYPTTVVLLPAKEEGSPFEDVSPPPLPETTVNMADASQVTIVGQDTDMAGPGW